MNWIVTDPSCNQKMLQLSENKFQFQEERILNPETKEKFTYESTIDLSDYTEEEMFESVSPFGYSFDEMRGWINEGKNLSLIAECIFEMES